jgi:DNA replication protein DnaC
MEAMATESDCPKCGGTGWIIVERANVSAAEACDCRFAGRAARREERAQLPPLYRRTSFENFEVPGPDNPIGRRELTGVLLAVKNYVREFGPDSPRPGLLLVGEQGTGKTHLAVAALRAIMGKGYDGLFFDYQNLIDRIRSGFDPNSNSSDKEAYRVALETEVLLLDDLGAQRTLDWVQDTITSILTYRCNNKKALIATTNLPDADAGSTVVQRNPALDRPEYRRTLAEALGARARSRLFEMCTVVHMPAVEDYRLRRAKIL